LPLALNHRLSPFGKLFVDKSQKTRAPLRTSAAPLESLDPQSQHAEALSFYSPDFILKQIYFTRSFV
jgi:hypothetical protein